MAGKITELTELTTTIATGDLQEIIDISEAVDTDARNKKISYENITKRNQVVPCTLEVPEGTIAFPDIHTMVTQVSKVSGMVLPDGATASKINFKCVVPEDLHTTPAMSIRVRIMTLSALAASNVRLTVETVGIADTEDADIANTAETETTVSMPTTIETLDYYTQDLTTDWAAGDTLFGQLGRDPVDGADDHAGDIMIIGIDLLVDTVGST